MQGSSEHIHPWRCDDVLVCVSGVEWVAKNVFLVAVPSYARKLSCELTAVDVPRGTAATVTHVVAAVLAHVNDAMRVYLRQDVYSDFPLEGYGDIIFSAESRAVRAHELHWCSLQETLVRAGVACVVRPCVVRCTPLLQAELQPDAAGTAPWLAQLRQRERGPLFCAARRCTVADVMRGDVYRVTWAADDADGAETVPLPQLLVLDATVCQPPSTVKGYAALRWAQTHLLHRELRVHVHAVYPSDKDVAYNTQLETYEHLANARCTAWVSEGGESGEAVDVGEVLVGAGLAWVRRAAEAGVPRASNLLPLCCAVGNAAAEALVRRYGNVDSARAVSAAMARAWRLPSAAAAKLADFNGAWWAAAAEAAASLPGDGIGATRELWRRVLWCGDLHTDPNDEPRVYRHRPLRTLFPLAALALRRVRLTGHVDGAAVVRCGATKRAFLQVEVTAVTPSAEWKLHRRAAGYADTCAVTFSPAPTDAVYARGVNVAISATGLSDDTETRLRVSCKHYLAETFLLSQHTPSKDWVLAETGEYVAPLSLRGTGQQPTIFVLDVIVEGRDEHAMTWTQRTTDRAVYAVSPDHNGLEADEPDDGGAGAGGEKGKVTTGAEAKTSRGMDAYSAAPSVSFLSKVSLFFELHAARLEGEGGNVDGGADLLPRIHRAFADLLYDDVVVVPVGVAEVNGVRGLVGDLLFPQEPVPRATRHPLQRRADAPFHRSLLTSIGWKWWGGGGRGGADATVAGTSWPMRDTVCDAVQTSFGFATEGVAQAERAARQTLLEEVQWAYGLLEQQAQNTFPTYQPPLLPFAFDELPPTPTTAPPPCLCLTAGRATLWHDSAAACPRLELAAGVLPPTVPLSLFAARPRELFYSAASKKKTVVARAAGAPPPQTLQAEAYAQLDWAFMRLQLPNLPNLLRLDWERLPCSLRNTERALCASIVDNAVSTCNEPGMLYASERIFSSFLSYLALLQAMSCTASGAAAGAAGADTTLGHVYAAMQHYTAPMLDDVQRQMRFSATLYVLPPFKAAGDGRPVPHSRPLFLGSRGNYVTDLFDTPAADNASPEIASFPLPREVTRGCVSALGVDVLVRRCDDSATRDTCASVDAGLEPDRLRTLGGGALGWGASKESGTPVLYHPTPRVAVLGAPLVERDEITADAIGRLRLERDLFADLASSSLRRKVFSLHYCCLSRFAEKNPYKSLSYGRVSMQDMYMTLMRERARGTEVQAYMSLLLRKCRMAGPDDDAAATFPDGELTVYGLPAEPLYVHYRSRADLRFTFSTACAPLRQELLAVEAAHLSDAEASAAIAAVEERLLALYTKSAADFVRRIYERVRRDQTTSVAVEQVYLSFTLQPRDTATAPHLAIQVFPVLPTDAETAERVLDHAALWHGDPKAPPNPHRTFSLYGSRFGRLPLAELRVAYDAASGAFVARWNEAYEGAPAAAP